MSRLTEHVLTLDDLEGVTELLLALQLRLSEFSFPNLYLFRDIHKYSLLQNQHQTLISGVTRDGKSYLMPLTPSESDRYVIELRDLLSDGRWDFIFPVPEEWVDRFSEDTYNISINDDDTDYLFLTDKMTTYPGKKMHKKRNLLNQFLRQYKADSSPISTDVLSQAIHILDTWQITTPHELETSDYYQAREALELRDELHLTHAMYFADGKPMGFILGEPLNEDTFAIHIAKADIRFKGAYQYLFSAFAQEHCAGYLYINMEQDMGIEGLRKTKRSYRPDLMARKYRISLKTG